MIHILGICIRPDGRPVNKNPLRCRQKPIPARQTVLPPATVRSNYTMAFLVEIISEWVQSREAGQTPRPLSTRVRSITGRLSLPSMRLPVTPTGRRGSPSRRHAESPLKSCRINVFSVPVNHYSLVRGHSLGFLVYHGRDYHESIRGHIVFLLVESGFSLKSVHV
jgi:hypothetical protein